MPEALRRTHPVAESDVDGRIADVGHPQVAHVDVFHRCAVDRLQSQSPAVGERTSPYGDMAESAVALRAQFDAACGAVAVRCSGGGGGAGACHERAHIVAAHVTVFNQHVCRGLGPPQGV